ncbi:MAG TPA: cytochrome c biogenesis protein CcdA, partial [Pirellulales bacterium]|nr:cytochrome c biogenesis protein CcdA [Pirellulales bacterium]
KYREVEDVAQEPGSAATGGKPGDGSSNGGGGIFDGGDFQPVGVAGTSNSLFLWMATGCLAGLILNIMPCVLPVIGLKLLSFVEQSGHHRGQAFLLNVWYSLGIIAVFLVLATLPVAGRLWFNTHFAWGQQFAYDPFNITLTAVVFVMALSFLGVWEIPIPGFVGGGKAGELAAKEGFAGAFTKGAITTVLATPCGGPLLAPALGYAVTEPPLITYAMFISIGLGMASPYLLIGAFPRLIRFLPKPGAWMDTFKQMMGFVLLGTVVLLMSFIRWPAMVPTLALLMGLWAGCWWIGRTPLYADLPVKARAWAAAVVFASLIGVMAFRWIAPKMEERFNQYVAAVGGGVMESPSDLSAEQSSLPADDHHLPWRRFSSNELRRLTAEGKTVMVDFTADWCLTCKTLEATVLNTQGTKEWVMKNGVVTMVADMTRWPEAESDLLSKLTPGSSIPVLAIFPAERPNQPIVLTGFYTQATLFEKLKEAGASKDAQAAGGLTAMK